MRSEAFCDFAMRKVEQSKGKTRLLTLNKKVSNQAAKRLNLRFAVRKVRQSKAMF